MQDSSPEFSILPILDDDDDIDEEERLISGEEEPVTKKTRLRSKHYSNTIYRC